MIHFIKTLYVSALYKIAILIIFFCSYIFIADYFNINKIFEYIYYLCNLDVITHSSNHFIVLENSTSYLISQEDSFEHKSNSIGNTRSLTENKENCRSTKVYIQICDKCYADNKVDTQNQKIWWIFLGATTTVIAILVLEFFDQK